jgi:hypothetical protein
VEALLLVIWVLVHTEVKDIDMEYLPEYNRGESLIGYVSRCSTGRKLSKEVPLLQTRVGICKDHAELSRKLLRQPFNKK